MNKVILKNAGLNALGTIGYIMLVAAFFANAARLLGNKPDNHFLIPIAMLLLFVCSAAVTGFLVLGRPVMWYLDGKKKEAVQLLAVTLVMLFCAMVVAFFAIALA